MRKALDISKIRKRKISLESSQNCKDSKYLYNNVRNSLSESKSTIKADSEKFFLNCVDSFNANRYYKKCINIMESVDSKLIPNLSTIFADQIVPSIIDLDSIKESVIESKLSDDVKDMILFAIKENKIADRVLNNSKNISKRFNLEKILVEKQHLPLYESVFDCCSLIDTYDIPNHGKMNIALEQISYYLQKNAIPYKRSDLADYVTEYFLLSDYKLTDNAKVKYCNVLEQNIFLEDEDIKSNPIIAKIETDPVRAHVLAFMNSEEKNDDNLEDTVNSILSIPSEFLVKNFSTLLDFIRIAIKCNAIESKTKIVEILQTIFSTILSEDLYMEQRVKLADIVSAEIVLTKRIAMNTDNTCELEQYDIYIQALIDGLRDIKYSLNSVYPDQVAKEMYVSDTDAVPLNEFKIFKFQNLLTAILNIDNFLSRKGNTFINKIKTKTKELFTPKKKDFFHLRENFDMSYITSNNRFDYCIAVYEANSEDDCTSIHQEMTALCKAINESINLPNGSRVYYINIAETFELHFEDTTYLVLSEAEKKECEKTMTEYDIYNWSTISQIENLFDEVKSLDLDKVEECFNTCEDPAKIIMLAEAMQYTGLATKEEMSIVLNKYTESHNDYLFNTKIYNLLNEWTSNVDDYNTQKDAIIMIDTILNEKFDLNALKLSLEGLKKKTKDLGSKEKEMSRDLDITVNHFMNSMKSAVTNNSREQIIKGSVIPSFSKCMKTAIALAGIGFVAGPITAAITAFAGLAVSKNMNRKERALMLDEIDIELQVVDREIQKAENNGSSKKYRQLLTYQKKLQREKQRIKYNIKLGDSNRPDASVGTAYKKD